MGRTVSSGGGIINKAGSLFTKPLTGKGFNEILFGGTIEPEREAQQLKGFALEGAKTQQRGLQTLEKSFGDPSKIARAGIAREVKGLQSSADDARRLLQSKIAQRGLGKTSLGLGAQVGLQRDAAEKIASVQASLPERIQALNLQKAQGLLQGGGNVIRSINAPFQFQPVQTPGLAPLIGTAAGGILGFKAGGSKGALTGAQVGSGVGQGLGGIFRS